MKWPLSNLSKSGVVPPSTSYLSCVAFSFLSRTTHSYAMVFTRVSRLTRIEVLLLLVDLEQLQVNARSHLVCIYLRGRAKTPVRFTPIWENEFCFLIVLIAPLKTVKYWPPAKANKRIQPHFEVNLIITHFPSVHVFHGRQNNSRVL